MALCVKNEVDYTAILLGFKAMDLSFNVTNKNTDQVLLFFWPHLTGICVYSVRYLSTVVNSRT